VSTPGFVKHFGAVLAAILVMTGVSTSIANAGAPPPIGPRWGVRIVFPGSFSNLIAARGDAYAIRDWGRESGHNQIARIDPVAGRDLALSSYLPGADSLIYANGSLWTTGVASITSKGIGSPVIVQLNPLTLKKEKTFVYPSASKPILIDGPSGEIWAYGGWSRGPVCEVRRIDSSSGAALTVYRLPGADGVCAGAAFDVLGRFLYVVTGGGGGVVALYKIDPTARKIVSSTPLPDFSQFVTVAATPERVWMAGGEPGTNGAVLYFSSSPLRLLAASPADGSSNRVSALPNFSQFASVDISGGRVWVGSDGTVGCFKPSSRKVLATYIEYHGPVLTDSFVVVGREMWANSNTGGPPPPTGLARVDPPAACWR
jgi:hypothetical protein